MCRPNNQSLPHVLSEAGSDLEITDVTHTAQYQTQHTTNAQNNTFLKCVYTGSPCGKQLLERSI